MKIEYDKKFKVFAYSKEDKRFYFFMLIGKDFVTFDMEKIRKNEKIFTRYRIGDYGIKKFFTKHKGISKELIEKITKEYKK